MKIWNGSQAARLAVTAPSATKTVSTRQETHEVPRGVTRWLTILTILIIGTWLMVGLLVVQRGARGIAGSDSLATGNASVNKSAFKSREINLTPWGQLEILPITIAPSLEMVPEYAPIQATQVAWRIPNANSSELISLLTKIGISESLREKLVSMAKINPEINGFNIEPPRDFVLGLRPDDRSKLYLALGVYFENFDQMKAFRFCGDDPEKWLKHSAISPETKDLILPLIYRYGGFMFFADLRSIEPNLKSAEERLQLVKTLSKEATFKVLIHVTPDSDIDALVSYWGRGGRAKDVRPLLESMANVDGGDKCNIMSLLPPFARQRLNTYPIPAEVKATVNQDCHWSALNFFARGEPNNRYCDEKEVAAAIQNDYYRVFGNFQLGDLVLFLDEQNNLFHSAVYVADDILFTKNGNLSQRPWMLIKLEDMKYFYPMPKMPEIRIFRHKDV
jgi:hypothetical protein